MTRTKDKDCGVSSSKQTHETLVPDVQLEEGPNMMRVGGNQCKYRLVPTQLSTKGHRLGTDNMPYPLVPILQFHRFWAVLCAEGCSSMRVVPAPDAIFISILTCKQFMFVFIDY